MKPLEILNGFDFFYGSSKKIIRRLILTFFICIFLFLIISCRNAPPKSDLRAFVPNETLVYLETNDLEKMLAALTDNKAFRQLAKSKEDFSAFSGVQVAVAVTGFEVSDKELTAEHSVLNFKPRFVAVADTHTFETANLSLVENQLNDFVSSISGDDSKFETIEKSGVKMFVWTAKDGRKIFSAVSESLIYFGNDEAGIEKFLAVKRGETENLTKNESLAREREKAANALAFGFVTNEGTAQISNLITAPIAVNATEDNEERQAVAQILAPILQKTFGEIVWTARKNETEIEDNLFLKTDVESTEVFKETLKTSAPSEFQKADFLPTQVLSLTRYTPQNPQIAWRSILLTSAKKTDETTGKIIVGFADSLFEPYGIGDAETFLSAIGADIVTAKFDDEGDKTVVIADVKDSEKLKKTIAEEINFKLSAEKISNADVWKSEDKTSAAAFLDNKIILGETESVLNCLKAKESGANFRQNEAFQRFTNNSALSVTYGKDSDTAQKTIEILGETKSENQTYNGFYTTETKFSGNGFERKTVSDFGLFGMILESLGDN